VVCARARVGVGVDGADVRAGGGCVVLVCVGVGAADADDGLTGGAVVLVVLAHAVRIVTMTARRKVFTPPTVRSCQTP